MSLERGLGNFRSVAEASRTDPLLRAANCLVLIFPFYTAAGYVCDTQYKRYLERRQKRIARASSCSARLQLTVSREEAEKDEWQMQLLTALGERLQLPATRLQLQGLCEGQGLALKVQLTRPQEASQEPSCRDLWHKLKVTLKACDGPLTAVRDILVDGDQVEKKCYSIWLTPKSAAADLCKKTISDLSESDGPTCHAHVPILQYIDMDQQEISSVVERVARETSPIAVEFDSLDRGDDFYRRVYLRAKKTPELCALHMDLASLLPRSTIPNLGKGHRQSWLDMASHPFEPCLPLCYGKLTPGAAKLALEEANFVAPELSLWETQVDDVSCKSWKQISSFKFEGKKPPSFGRLLLRFSREATPELLKIGVGSVCSVLANLLVDLACSHDSDLYTGKYIGKSTEELIRVLGRGMLLWGSFMQLSDFSNDIMRSAGKQIGCRLRKQLFSCLIQQDVKWIQQKGADELYKTLMTRTDNIQRVFTNKLPNIISMCANLVTNIGFLWLSKPRLCAFGIGMFAFQNIGRGIWETLLKVVKDHEEQRSEAKENALEVLQNFRVVRAFAREDKEKKAFAKFMSEELKIRASDFVEKISDFGSWFTSEFAFQVAYLYGGILVNIKYIRADEVKDAVQKAFKATRPLYQLRRNLLRKSTFVEDACAVLEALERPPDIPFEDDTKFNPKPEEVIGEIEAKGASFSYGDDLEAAALKDLNFRIHQGSMVGLVGPSGCGKSTLFNLLLRFYDPQMGSICIDGKDLASWNPQALYRAVAWVSQDQCVFKGSVIDNIRYGLPEASEEEVLRVMREADLYDDVLKKPSGVDTPANELSGGQKQRLSIARALLRNPKILLLDEATSALDTVSERKVQKALDKLMKGRTVIAIAHRLSTIVNADLIIVMEAGKIIEQGTHAELLRKPGKYADLVKQQLAVEEKKEKTTDPQAVEDGAVKLEKLRAKVPEELQPEVDEAVQALRDAAATLREERKRLAMKERSLMDVGSKWKTAGKVRQAVRVLQLVRASSEETPQRAPPVLQRHLSAGT